MSTPERSPSFSYDGVVEPYDPTKVAGAARLLERLNASPSPSAEDAAETPVIDALDGPADFSDESTPIFDQLQDGDASVESTTDATTSRVADFLRRSANGVDTASEKWDDTKRMARKKIGLIGRTAARIGISTATATGEFAAGVASVAATKGLEVADRADTALFNAVDSATESVKATATAAADKTGEAIMNGMSKVESGMDIAGDKMIAFKDGVKEKLLARKQRALERKQARRERWSQRWTNTKESVNNGLDKSAELAMAGGRRLEDGMDYVGDKMLSAQDKAKNTAERTRASVKAIRSIGRIAIDTRRV